MRGETASLSGVTRGEGKSEGSHEFIRGNTRERASGFSTNLSVRKQLSKYITIYALITAKASAATTSVCPRRVGRRAREARGRVRRGSLLDEGAADKGEVKFEKER